MSKSVSQCHGIDLCNGKLISILGLSEAALGEGTGAKLQKLSVKQIKSVSVRLN